MSTSDQDNFKTSSAFNRTAAFFGDDRADTSDQTKEKEDRKRREAADAAAKAAAAGRVPDPMQFETRRQDYSSAASAAGAQRTGSDADLLGFVGSRARRAGAARRILGD